MTDQGLSKLTGDMDTSKLHEDDKENDKPQGEQSGSEADKSDITDDKPEYEESGDREDVADKPQGEQVVMKKDLADMSDTTGDDQIENGRDTDKTKDDKQEEDTIDKLEYDDNTDCEGSVSDKPQWEQVLM